MNNTVLVTGASGFIGRHVCRHLAEAGIPCRGLSRSGVTTPSCESVRGDVTRPEDLDAALEGVDAVVHLAAATGKATSDEMTRVNVGGTKAVLAACTRHGIRRLIHVSTIAVTYADLSGYPYGESKRLAEEAVKGSDVEWTILRPTIVLGPGSPALGPFRSLAAGPFMMVPGGGSVTVQPIDVRDVADAVVAVVRAAGRGLDGVVGATFELGGPERLSMKQLLARVRADAGRGDGPSVTIPLGLLGAVAACATAVLGSRSPVTPGQLTAFRYDSTARALPSDLVAMNRTIDQMLADDGSGRP